MLKQFTKGIVANKSLLFRGICVILCLIIIDFLRLDGEEVNHGANQSQKPESHEYKLRPLPTEIMQAILVIAPFQRKLFAQNYVGLKMKWKARLFSANHTGDELLSLRLKPSGHDKPFIKCKVPIVDYPVLKTAKEGTNMWVYGRIKGASPNSIELSDVSLEFEKTSEPIPVPEPSVLVLATIGAVFVIWFLRDRLEKKEEFMKVFDVGKAKDSSRVGGEVNNNHLCEVEENMSEGKKGRFINNFLRHLAKGNVKTIPLIGGILEEAIFGTLEGEEAAEEAIKMNDALENLGQKIKEQSVTLRDVLSELESGTSFRKEVRDLLDEVRHYFSDELGSISVPQKIKKAVENLFSRYNEIFDEALEEKLADLVSRLNEAVAHVPVRKGVYGGEEDKVITRVNILLALNSALGDDLDQLIVSFPEADQYISGTAPKKRRVIDFVRWAESPGKPGLQAICERARELGINF